VRIAQDYDVVDVVQLEAVGGEVNVAGVGEHHVCAAK
jgi:hypothetical protein